jgi:Zn finger protein HypA/HybF involved in hydrogenase expression
MGEWEIECLDCGWRGRASDLEKGPQNSEDKTLIFCPDCGGAEFKDRGEKEESPTI